MQVAHSARRSSLTMLDSAYNQLQRQTRHSSTQRRGSLIIQRNSVPSNLASRISTVQLQSTFNKLTKASIRNYAIAPTVPTATATMYASHAPTHQMATKGVYRMLTHRMQNVSKVVTSSLKFQIRLIDAAFRKHPLLCGSTFAGIKGILADLFAQRVVEGKSSDQINWHRNALFGAVGVMYTGFVVYAVYVKIYPKLFKRIEHWHWLKQATTKSFIDQFIHNMIIYFPFFYAFKAGVYDGFSVENCKEAVSKYLNENIYDDMLTSMAVWGPANIITFGFIPSHLKTPWLSCVSFIWIIVLSTLRGEKADQLQTDEQNVNAIEAITDEKVLEQLQALEKEIGSQAIEQPAIAAM